VVNYKRKSYLIVVHGYGDMEPEIY